MHGTHSTFAGRRLWLADCASGKVSNTLIFGRTDVAQLAFVPRLLAVPAAAIAAVSSAPSGFLHTSLLAYDENSMLALDVDEVEILAEHNQLPGGICQVTHLNSFLHPL